MVEGPGPAGLVGLCLRVRAKVSKIKADHGPGLTTIIIRPSNPQNFINFNVLQRFYAASTYTPQRISSGKPYHFKNFLKNKNRASLNSGSTVPFCQPNLCLQKQPTWGIWHAFQTSPGNIKMSKVFVSVVGCIYDRDTKNF